MTKSQLGFRYRRVIPSSDSVPPIKAYIHGADFKVVYGHYPSLVVGSVSAELWRHRESLSKFNFILAACKGFLNPDGKTCDKRTYVRGYEVKNWEGPVTEYAMVFRQGMLVSTRMPRETWEIEPANKSLEPTDVLSGFEEASIVFGEELRLRRRTRNLQEFLKQFPSRW